MPSALYLLHPDQLSLLNSLLRNGDTSVREIARMTYDMSSVGGHRRSQRGWEALLYRHKKAGGHLRCVREQNLLADRYAISDLQIKSIELALSGEEKPNLALLNSIKGVKPVATSLLDKLRGDIDSRIAAADKDPPGGLSRSSDQSFA